MDKACVQNGQAFDTGVNVLTKPEEHTYDCLMMKVCIESGFVSLH